MKLPTLLIALMLLASALMTGCDPSMEQSITQVITTPESALEKARTVMESVNERRTAAHQMAEETGDFSAVFTASEDIFREELGLRTGLWVDLVEIYRQENLENPEMLGGLDNLEDAFAEKLQDDTLEMFYFAYIRAFDPLIIEYLRLSFAFPEKSEAELLILFGESMRDGAASVIFP